MSKTEKIDLVGTKHSLYGRPSPASENTKSVLKQTQIFKPRNKSQISLKQFSNHLFARHKTNQT